MNFLVNKLLFVFVLSNAYFGTDFDLPRNDILVLDNGEEVTCQVSDVQEGFVQVNIKGGERTVVREINIDSARDMLEVGIVRTKRYTGRLMFLNEDYAELKTSTGTVKIEKGFIRKIIISQEPSFNL